ncbi:hypothetical protein OG921_17475 [Aldersonia sp. NBC_00410]|uniref:hypothetical protein n=1 Tax=Aldersonia sp. NBC_00410 TaxID=2975954 RepID=UPI00224FB356|nr:hypothetical protein [Aldersonia sp. NBC_00410]MCX5044962.1 hypothetical protein [Aldersonia sp. NBC_00410]
MKKVKPIPFRDKNGKRAFNSSGVLEAGPGRFVFIDNNDPTALFDLFLDDEGGHERIRRRPIVGMAKGLLSDPEGLTWLDRATGTLLVASSLCRGNDGLVRVRYRADGDLPAEAIPGFRDWLITRVPELADAAMRDPDDGGLNIEGAVWDPTTRALLLGLRGPANPGRVTLIRIPVRADAKPWTTAALGPPARMHLRVPDSKHRLGIRDISNAASAGFLLLLGRSLSHGDEPFHLCTWNGRSDTLELLDIKFHKSAKPEGLTTFTSGDGRRILVVDDCGGYAILDAIS